MVDLVRELPKLLSHLCDCRDFLSSTGDIQICLQLTDPIVGDKSRSHMAESGSIVKVAPKKLKTTPFRVCGPQDATPLISWISERQWWQDGLLKGITCTATQANFVAY
jgi:hypothetical protein